MMVFGSWQSDSSVFDYASHMAHGLREVKAAYDHWLQDDWMEWKHDGVCIKEKIDWLMAWCQPDLKQIYKSLVIIL